MLIEVKTILENSINQINNVIANKNANMEQEIRNQIAINEREVVCQKFNDIDLELSQYVERIKKDYTETSNKLKSKFEEDLIFANKEVEEKKQSIKETEEQKIRMLVSSKFNSEINELNNEKSQLEKKLGL